MARGLSGAIKTELGLTTFAAPIYCIRIKRKDGTYLRWSERNPTFDDGTGSHAYEARLQNIGGFSFSADESGPISITVSNVDGQLTTLDRAESFAGESCELIAYLPGLDTYYIPWSGYCDDVQSIDAEKATIQAYPGTANPHTLIPQRTIGIPCTHVFGSYATWVNYKDFDGSECPYQRDRGSTGNIGFVGALSGAIVAGTTSITAHWNATALANSAKWRKGDVILIGSERLLVTNSPADPDGSGNQTLTVTRGYKSTTAASHADNATMFFASCGYSTEYCKSRGMYGNNPNDTYGSSKKGNYFGGFPFMIGYDYGRYRSASGERAKPLRLTYSGNESGYGRTLPIVYGRARLSDAVLLMAKPEGDFLTTLWAVCEGVLATNTTNDDQTTPSDAYLTHSVLDSSGATYQVENIYVNGESRHDPRPGYGIELYNGTQNQQEPGSAFISGLTDFTVNNLGFWGTARVIFRINRKDSPSVDVQGQSITGAFEIAYGRVVRVYSDAVTFTRKATTSPAWAIADMMTSKRSGGGLDHARLNLQSFVDFATYCAGTVTSTFDQSTVSRWTFNGVIDQRRSYDEWIHLMSIGAYCLPPFIDKDGLRKIKALKSESTSGVPLFSSKVASTTGRNIIWENDHSSLVKSRRPIAEIPNEIRVNYVDLGKVHFTASLHTSINGTSDPVTVSAQWLHADVLLGAKFRQNDVILMDTEQLLVTNSPSDPDGSDRQSLTCQRAYAGTAKAAHSSGATIQFQSDHSKVSVVIADRDSQTDLGLKLGDNSRRAITKSIDLPGTSSLDEAARLATLLLRAGEFGQGGLSNNLKIVFKAFYRDAEDLEIGDIFEAEDDQLDAASGERYFRVTHLSSQPMPVNDGGFVFIREIEGVLHDNAIYDDTALTVSKFDRIDTGGANDKAPPPVTNFAVAESGVTDGNGVNTTRITITYDEPDPPENYRSLIIFACNDDGAGNQVGDWRYVTDLHQSGESFQFEVANPAAYKWFAGVSRPLSGHRPNEDALDQDGFYVYPRSRVLVDGVTDATFPDAPAVNITRSQALLNTALYNLTIGVDTPGSPANWLRLNAVQIQVSTDNTFGTFPTGKSLDHTYSTLPPFTIEFATNYPGTYYARARVKNALGWGSYGSTSISTDILDSLTADTGLIAGVTPTLAIKTASTDHIAGTDIAVTFDIPTANASTYFGHTVIAHSSAILPSVTKLDSGTAGRMTSSVATLTDLTKSWVVDAYVNKYVVAFDSTRGGSPTYEFEGQIVMAKILSNTATVLTFDADSQNLHRTRTGLTYFIVNSTELFWNKVKFATPCLPDPLPGLSQSRTRTVIIPGGTGAAIYTWVILYNAYGSGKVTASPPNSTTPGHFTAELADVAVTTAKLVDSAVTNVKVATDAITTTKIADNQISTPKLIALSVTAAKIEAWTITAAMLSAGTVTAGTFIGTTFKTASSGSRVEWDSTNGIRAYDGSGNLLVQIPVSGGSAGYILARNILGQTADLFLASSGGAAGGSININATQLTFNVSGTGYMTLTSSGPQAVNCNFNVNSGYGLASGGTSFACATNPEIYRSSTLQADFDNTSSATNTVARIRLNGSMRRLAIWNDGTRDLLYLV